MEKIADIKVRRINDEVFVAEEQIVRMGAQHVTFLKRQAASNARRRARICAHKANDDSLHEMLIAIMAGSYIHPHKHIRKIESFHIIEGAVDIVLFDDAGTVVDVVELGDISTGRNFYYRLSDSMYHTLLIHGDCLVIHEVTSGPFIKEETILATFAPPEARCEETSAYISGIARMAAKWHQST